MSKREKILFHYPILNTGGAEKSTLKLINQFLNSGWEVHLVLTTKGGNFESAIDPRTKVIYLRSRTAGTKFKTAKSLVKKLSETGDLLLYLLTRLQEFIKSIFFLIQRYDAAVISLMGLSPKFCCRYVKASRRVQWIRNDLLFCDENNKARRNIEKYNHRIDAYLCVSETTRESFCKKYPGLAHKAFIIYNLIEPEEMIKKAKGGPNPFEKYAKKIKIVTVCRLNDGAKGLLRMAKICKKMVSHGIDFVWLLVGDGPDKNLIFNEIKKLGIEEYLVLCGLQDNPYPFIYNADIVAVLSKYEGLSGVVNEAKILGKPVVATEFSGIREQIVNWETGLILANNEDAVFEGMKKITTDSSLRLKFTNNCLPNEITDDDLKMRAMITILKGRRR